MVTEQLYRENEAVSQSKLKLLLGNNPKLFITVEEPDLYFEEKEHFNIGDGVDIQLTQSMEVFEEVFHISNVQNKPSDAIKSILNQVFDLSIGLGIEPTELSDEIYKGTIVESCRVQNYSNNLKDDTLWQRICEHTEYWDDLRASQGKRILSATENDKISNIVMSIRTSENTSRYFNMNPMYQLPLYFEYEGISCKALLDMVIFNHEDKTIQPIDIKTLGDNVLNFHKSIRRRRYDIQAAFYTEALTILYPDYTILPFLFIVESTTDIGTPVVYECESTLLSIGKNGIDEYYIEASMFDVSDSIATESRVIVERRSPILGFHQLIELYKYYLEHG